ncbi:MAG: DUF934 domain-containing protein [Methylococcales bacterium]|nr:DUF934 domain-containing protein [Methylococcales bacterium]
MQIIKNNQLIENHWTYLEDDAPVAAGNICVSLARWQAEKGELSKHAGNLGVRLSSTDDIASLGSDLGLFALIELNFENFADGRSFTQAYLLRNRYGFQGEIRAVGSYLADQAFQLSRVGVNGFNPEKLQQTHATLNDFTVFYQ